MNLPFNKILVLLIFIVISGCQSTNPYKISPSPKPYHVDLPVSLLVGSDLEDNAFCDSTTYKCENIGDVSPREFRRALVDSGVFQKVEIRNRDHPLKIYVNYRLGTGENDSLHIPKTVFAAVTIFLVPVTMNFESKADFAVIYEGKILRKYSYEVSSKAWIQIFGTKPSDMSIYAIESLSSQFLDQLARDDILSPIEAAE